jgi:hypothetical protein
MNTGGKVVKEGDDLMCATRYALMMAPRLDSQVLSQFPPPNRLPEAGLDMSDREFVVWRNLKNEHGQCSRCVTRDGTLDVRTHLGSKCTQLGGSPPDILASILMREINSSAKCGDSY